MRCLSYLIPMILHGKLIDIQENNIYQIIRRALHLIIIIIISQKFRKKLNLYIIYNDCPLTTNNFLFIFSYTLFMI